MKKFKELIIVLGFLLLISQKLFTAINYTPSQPNVEQQVILSVTHPDGIVENRAQWDFGDKTPLRWDSTTVAKTYIAPGTYTVKASYWTNRQEYVTDQTTITIVERRKITFRPSYPVINQPVTLSAENFLSTNIRWDFGDGTIISCNSAVETHAYTEPGTYIVRAWDWCGNSVATISTTLDVLEFIKGPRAPFQISFIQLRFEDGKSYKVVPKDFEPLVVFADIKYEGTGILQAQWIVDGKPFRLMSKSLPYAKQTIINSGDIPGLPTQIPGIHEISLKIVQPQTEYSIPIIRYFVSLKKIEREKADFSLSKVLKLDEIEIPAVIDSIETPAKDYFLLKGTIKNENTTALPFVLLRIYLGNELIDQQLIKGLKPGEEIEFETSIHNPSSEPKRMYITLYNVSQKPANLLFIKRLNILPKEK